MGRGSPRSGIIPRCRRRNPFAAASQGCSWSAPSSRRCTPWLRAAGHAPRAVRDAAAALELLEKEPPTS